MLSNSFNGVPGARQPLIGWGVGAAFTPWHNLRFVLDYTSFQGNNLGSPQHAHFPTVGAQYSHRIGRESIFGKMMFGEGWLNKGWAANGAIGTLGSFTMYTGGGIDTPISRHFSLRVEGGMQYTNLALETSLTSDFPNYRIPGLPNYFGRVSMGLVWAPRLAPPASEGTALSRTPSPVPESELAFEYEGSIGHSHFEAGTWWSYLHVAGFEYDRHTWGRFVGARMDYVAEILPITILRQPAVEDEYGDPLSHNFTTVPGLGVTPVGLRMLWRDGKVFKPFFTAKGGVVAFTQKALSPDGAYLNFTLRKPWARRFVSRTTGRFVRGWANSTSQMRARCRATRASTRSCIPPLSAITCTVGEPLTDRDHAMRLGNCSTFLPELTSQEFVLRGAWGSYRCLL